MFCLPLVSTQETGHLWTLSKCSHLAAWRLFGCGLGTTQAGIRKREGNELQVSTTLASFLLAHHSWICASVIGRNPCQLCHSPMFLFLSSVITPAPLISSHAKAGKFYSYISYRSVALTALHSLNPPQPWIQSLYQTLLSYIYIAQECYF